MEISVAEWEALASVFTQVGRAEGSSDVCCVFVESRPKSSRVQSGVFRGDMPIAPRPRSRDGFDLCDFYARSLQTQVTARLRVSSGDFHGGTGRSIAFREIVPASQRRNGVDRRSAPSMPRFRWDPHPRPLMEGSAPPASTAPPTRLSVSFQTPEVPHAQRAGSQTHLPWAL